MGTTSIILTLVLICSAIVVAVRQARLRNRMRHEPRGEPVPPQKPKESQPTTTDAASQLPQDSPQRPANAPGIQGGTPRSGEDKRHPAPTVEHENAHPNTSLERAREPASEAARPVATTSEITKPAQQEPDIRVAPEESTDLEAGGSPPDIPPPEEPPIEDQEAVPVQTEATEERESEAAPANGAKPRRERAPVSPEDRGGRSRETVPKKEGGGEKKRRTRTPRPEIVCWKRKREWVLAVELPDGLSRKQNVAVIQDGQPLERDETENDCWRLARLHGEVVVRVTDAENESVFTLSLGDDSRLVFKLSGDNRGRHVKHPSSGSCLVVVPADWKRDETLAGPPRISPEDVCLAGYRAHFFEL